MIYLLRNPPEDSGRAERRRMLRSQETPAATEDAAAPAEEPAG
jgi:hypothetical protein